ncbi:MAG: helix-turn-helix transcriptional regulator [Clostridia bacterium]|nr:helix-turn-helix transcriptional regulator [Clostridia bacterium]
MSFSENLMRLRKSKGLSQEEFANEIDVTRQTVSKWELGVSTPDMDKLVQMANFFGISVDDLLNSDDATSKVNPIVENTTQNETVDKNESYNPEPKKSSGILAKLFVLLLIGAIITIITILIILLVRDLGEKKNNNTTDNNIVNTVENTIENNTVNEVNNTVDDQQKQIDELQNKVNELENKSNSNSNSSNQNKYEKSDFQKNVEEKVEKESKEIQERFEKMKKEIEEKVDLNN